MCETCKFWQRVERAGECRRHTPVIIWGRGEHEDAIETHWPETFASEWYGEYESGKGGEQC